MGHTQYRLSPMEQLLPCQGGSSSPTLRHLYWGRGVVCFQEPSPPDHKNNIIAKYKQFNQKLGMWRKNNIIATNEKWNPKLGMWRKNNIIVTYDKHNFNVILVRIGCGKTTPDMP